MKVEEAARALGVRSQFVRAAMRSGRLDIGACAKLGKNKKRYSYVVVPEKLAKFMGITVEELERRLRTREYVRQDY